MDRESNVLLIEPFYSGSHKVLMDLLHEVLKSEADKGVKVHLATLPGKKWHWRARTSALYLCQTIPKETFTCIFTSCVLPLHELLGLRPDLQKAYKLIYFHENQLVYPVRKSKDRDFQYGYNQILSCLAADKVLFNSEFNRESFLSNIQPFFKLQPDFRPKNLRSQIEPKCFVRYFPMEFQKISEMVGDRMTPCSTEERGSRPPRIVWPHRWEFDKNPDLFFRTLFRLVESGITNFRLNILGESYVDNPPIFTEAQTRLKDFIDHFGYLPAKEDYYKVLAHSEIVVSTADHEFFGVAMMEAVHLGCIPICPKKLVYPELYSSIQNYNSEECLYLNEEDLFFKLRDALSNTKTFCKINFDTAPYDWKNLREQFLTDFLPNK